VRGAELFMQKYVSSACIYMLVLTLIKKLNGKFLYSDFGIDRGKGKRRTKECFGSIFILSGSIARVCKHLRSPGIDSARLNRLGSLNVYKFGL
jgi:hypothetical protein